MKILICPLRILTSISTLFFHLFAHTFPSVNDDEINFNATLMEIIKLYNPFAV